MNNHDKDNRLWRSDNVKDIAVLIVLFVEMNKHLFVIKQTEF